MVGHMGPGLGAVCGLLRYYLGRVVEQPRRPRPLRVGPCVYLAPITVPESPKTPLVPALCRGSWQKTLLISERAWSQQVGGVSDGDGGSCTPPAPSPQVLGVHLGHPSPGKQQYSPLSLCSMDSGRERAGQGWSWLTGGCWATRPSEGLPDPSRWGRGVREQRGHAGGGQGCPQHTQSLGQVTSCFVPWCPHLRDRSEG